MITKPVKYTAEFVLKELNSMLARLQSKKGEKIYYIGELFYYKPYVRVRFHEWAEKFNEDNPEISFTVRKIEDCLENNLVRDGLKRKISNKAAIFVLKNKHGWKDVQEIKDVKFDEEVAKTVKKLTDEALKKV